MCPLPQLGTESITEWIDKEFGSPDEKYALSSIFGIMPPSASLTLITKMLIKKGGKTTSTAKKILDDNTVILDRNGGVSLGIKVKKATVVGLGLAVKSVDEGSAAEASGKLHPGTVLTHVNDTDVTQMPLKQIASVLKDAGNMITFVIGVDSSTDDDGYFCLDSYSKDLFKVEDRVSVKGYDGLGTIKFVGSHHEVRGSARVLVEMDTPVGKNNGTVGGHTYASVSEGHGVLVKPKKCRHAQESTPPVITLAGDTVITVVVGDTYIDAGATATDEMDDDVTTGIVVTGSVDTSVAATYTLTYNVSDATGTAAESVTRTVTVEPILEISDVDDSDAESDVDNSDEDLDFSAVPSGEMSTSEAAHSFKVDDRVSVTGYDGLGTIKFVGSHHEVRGSARVLVELDTTTTGCNNGTIDGHTYTSVREGHGVFVKPKICTHVEDDTRVGYQLLKEGKRKQGKLHLMLECNHLNGENVTREAVVVPDAAACAEIDRCKTCIKKYKSANWYPWELTPPVITLAGDTTITVVVGDTYVDAGATATDEEDGDVTTGIVVTGSVDTSVAATYTLTYNVSDATGTAAESVTRTVTVEPILDSTPPVITLIGDTAITVAVGDTYIDAGATATDNVDNDVTTGIVAIGSVDTSVAATYTLTYNVSDATGTAAESVTRTVTVEQKVCGIDAITRDVNAAIALLQEPGCPDVTVDLASGTIEILKPIAFPAKKWDLIGDSKDILSQVSAVMKIVEEVGNKHNLPLAHFEVGGHTNAVNPNNRGKKSQIDMSTNRAVACADFIKEKGVNPDMLEAKGFGGLERKYELDRDEDPTMNQRVEFNLTNRGDLLAAIDVEAELALTIGGGATRSPSVLKVSPSRQAANSRAIVTTNLSPAKTNIDPSEFIFSSQAGEPENPFAQIVPESTYGVASLSDAEAADSDDEDDF